MHLKVLSRGDHVVVYSDDQGDKFNCARFSRIDVTGSSETYELGIAHHTGRWETTPFIGTLEELFEVVAGQFGWLLEDFQVLPSVGKELTRRCTSMGGRFVEAVKLIVVDDNGSEAEWRIGYVNDEPAVGDGAGRWYAVPDEVVVPQPSQQLVWLLQQGEWSCIHQMHWNPDYTPATNPDTWLLAEPVFIGPPS